MQASLNQNIDEQHGIAGVDGRAALPVILSCCAFPWYTLEDPI